MTVDLPQAGQTCTLCARWMAESNQPVHILVGVPKCTENRGIPIVICPFCDGDELVKLYGTVED